jgi:hypothetical protein
MRDQAKVEDAASVSWYGYTGKLVHCGTRVGTCQATAGATSLSRAK